ncbi:DUF3987 domain-containing protein [Variovorax paradoxus]|uniref:DUF3987 domain-containing protein n=1 Tax=Variovorax paradoxus TaxID=34073 RepID=UPI0019333B36|nr:DUF3987 domain-containing protein [Variovorax paradoxus]
MNYPNPANYPVNALGPVLAPAVCQHSFNTGVAVEMIASYARSIAHVGAQDNVDIQRPRCPPSPVSSFDLVSADSSEGKDTASRPFVGFLRKYEDALQERHALARLDRLAEEAAWKAQMRVLNKRLDQAASEGEDLDALKNEHRELMARRPAQAGEPKMLVDNITPGALENLIGEGSKSIFITSTEAGGLLNGRLGRSTDLLNNAWDSTPLVKDRVKEERVVLSDYRVCGHFALQGPVLQSIFARTGHLAHGSGLTARMLLTVPHSTLGGRYLRSDRPLSYDDIDAMGCRMRELFEQGARRREADEARCVIAFSEAAARYFDDIYNEIQANLGRGRILNDVAGHAGKTAEQIARVAGTLHKVEEFQGPLQVDVLERARQIGYWHLDQFLARFGAGQPGDQRIVDSEIVANALHTIAYRGLGYMARAEVRKWCAVPLSTARFDQALQVLIHQGIALLQKRGGRALVAANPWR